MQSNFDVITPERANTGIYNPPKVHENALFLYQSEHNSSVIRNIMAAQIPIAVIMTMHFDSLYMMAAYSGLGYFWFFNV